MVDRAPQLDRVGKHASASASSSSATNARRSVAHGRRLRQRLRNHVADRAGERRLVLAVRDRAARRPATPRPQSSAGSSGSARTCASAAAPDHERVGDRRAVAGVDGRGRRDQVVARAARARSAHAPGRTAPRRSAAASASGRPATTRTARRRPATRRPGADAARQVVGPGPHALAQLGHTAAGAPRRAARPARPRDRGPALTTPSSHSPVHGVELGREAPVLRAAGGARTRPASSYMPSRGARARPGRPSGSARPAPCPRRRRTARTTARAGRRASGAAASRAAGSRSATGATAAARAAPAASRITFLCHLFGEV